MTFSNISQNSLARLTGALYLLLVPLGVFGIIYIQEFLLVTGDTPQSIENILANETMYRWSILSAFTVQVIQILVAIAMYVLFKPYNRLAAILIVFFTIVAVPIAMLNELTHVGALMVLKSQALRDSFTIEQIHASVQLLLDLHSDGLMIAHIFWGLWLIPMGYVVIKSDFIPSIIGGLLIFAGLGYMLDTLLWFAFPNIDILVSEFTFVGEPILTLWLVIMGATRRSKSVRLAKDPASIA